MKFARESAKDCFNEAMPLLEKHWKEIAHFKDIPLDPDFDQYLKIEQLGMLRVFTAREDSGTLIGYAVFFVRANPHYKSSIQANQDILFIDPAHRGTGGKFILWCDNQLKAEGIEVVMHHIKAAHNFGKLLERFSYELVDLIYAKRLNITKRD